LLMIRRADFGHRFNGAGFRRDGGSFVCHNLEFQSAFARSIGEGFHFSVVL
jgi:hypothetical protein